MQSITTRTQLQLQIAELELVAKAQEAALKETLKETMETLKPVNLFKSVWKQVSSSPEIKENIVDTGIGLAAGFVSKKILVGNTHNPIKRLLGSLAQYGITNIVANHPDLLKSAGSSLIQLLRKKKKIQDVTVTVDATLT